MPRIVVQPGARGAGRSWCYGSGWLLAGDGMRHWALCVIGRYNNRWYASGRRGVLERWAVRWSLEALDPAAYERAPLDPLVHEVHAVGPQDAAAALVERRLGAEVPDDGAEAVPEPRYGEAFGQSPDEGQRVDVPANVVHEGACGGGREEQNMSSTGSGTCRRRCFGHFLGDVNMTVGDVNILFNKLNPHEGYLSAPSPAGQPVAASNTSVGPMASLDYWPCSRLQNIDISSCHADVSKEVAKETPTTCSASPTPPWVHGHCARLYIGDTCAAGQS